MAPSAPPGNRRRERPCRLARRVACGRPRMGSRRSAVRRRHRWPDDRGRVSRRRPRGRGGARECAHPQGEEKENRVSNNLPRFRVWLKHDEVSKLVPRVVTASTTSEAKRRALKNAADAFGPGWTVDRVDEI